MRILIAAIAVIFLQAVSASADDAESCVNSFINELYQDSLRHCNQVATDGNVDAQFILGYINEQGLGAEVNFNEAVRWYLAASKQDDALSQFNLGYLYLQGLGVAQDHEKAAHWFDAAAKQGLAEGQNGLASLYQQGFGVERNINEAVRLYKAAAEQGFGEAMLNLGMLYHQGLGVEQNYTSAYMWYHLADEVGQSAARQYKNQLARLMTNPQLALAFVFAERCLGSNFTDC